MTGSLGTKENPKKRLEKDIIDNGKKVDDFKFKKL